eukprot:TRINITY_DN1686_c0_g2_i1.p1 TRINITY_DN1686_c0_g2~~TRINITY_DN1686_c0_g2_i1.p1  ORF type:complete len:285 (-),score=17.73 TRINITY_DN1686_c0_g2_i1:4-858(-)
MWSCPENYREITADPTQAWAYRQSHKDHIVTPVTPLDPATTPKPEGHTRFVCISDTHSLHDFLRNVPDGDVLIHAGDFTNVGELSDVEALSEWFGALPHPHKVVIAGNHDLPFDPASYAQTSMKFGPSVLGADDPQKARGLLKNCTYIEDEEVTVCGFRIWGSPWSPRFCDWAFNLDRGEPCQKQWDLIPVGIDILVTHGPPLGHGDLCTGDHRAGCVNLLDTVEQRIKPKYHVFGHVHEGYGVTTNGVTTFINASSCNVNYSRHALNLPIVFDLPNPTTTTSH